MKQQLIENNNVNRLAFLIWAKHIDKREYDSHAWQYVDRKVSRLICRAIRKLAPDLVGYKFEWTYTVARGTAINTFFLYGHSLEYASKYVIDDVCDYVQDRLADYRPDEGGELPPPPEVIYLTDDDATDEDANETDEQAECDLSLPPLPHELDDLVLTDEDADEEIDDVLYMYDEPVEDEEVPRCVYPTIVDCTPYDDEEREPLYWEWDDDDIYELALRD